MLYLCCVLAVVACLVPPVLSLGRFENLNVPKNPSYPELGQPCGPRVLPENFIPGACGYPDTCGAGVWEDSSECKKVVCCKQEPDEYARPRTAMQRCAGGQGVCQTKEAQADTCDTFGLFPKPFPPCSLGLSCCIQPIPLGPMLGDLCGNGQGMCVNHPCQANRVGPSNACNEGICCGTFSKPSNPDAGKTLANMFRTSLLVGFTSPVEARDSKRLAAFKSTNRDNLLKKGPAQSGDPCAVLDDVGDIRGQGKCGQPGDEGLFDVRGVSRWKRTCVELIEPNGPRACASMIDKCCFAEIFDRSEEAKVDIFTDATLADFVDGFKRHADTKEHWKAWASRGFIDLINSIIKKKQPRVAQCIGEVVNGYPTHEALTGPWLKDVANVAIGLITQIDPWISKYWTRALSDYMTGFRKCFRSHFESEKKDAIEAVERGGRMENSNKEITQKIVPFPLVKVSTRSDELKNFFYGHRSYAAFAPLLFKTDLSRWQRFRSTMMRTLPSSKPGAKRIVRYYSETPEVVDSNTKSISAAVKAMEGNPYMAAWAINYISKNNVRSIAPLTETTMLQQPIEVDIYIPPNLGQRMISGEMLDWTRIIEEDIKVGHAGTVTMVKELFNGCEVTNGKEVSQFIELGTWLRVLNAALLYLAGEDSAPTPEKIYSDDSTAKGTNMQRLYKTDLQLVLDIKCHFEKATPLDALVRNINDIYGVVINGIGSFYKLPALNSLQRTSQGVIPVPPRSYQWFFSPKNLIEGISTGRMSAGSFALVTASSLLSYFKTKSGSCVYQIDQAAVEILRNAQTHHRLKLGIWTLEAELSAQAFGVISTFADRNKNLFQLGFALGGPHRTDEWPLVGECGMKGGLDNFSFIPNK